MEEKIKQVIYGVGAIIVLLIFVYVFIWNCAGCPGSAYPSKDPYKASENLLKLLNASIFQEKFSSRIDFTKEDKINAEDLSVSTGLAKNQICLNVSN